MSDYSNLDARTKEALDEMTWWMTDNTCIGMGAERQFDYTMRGDLSRDLEPRLGHCYELAMGAFNGWNKASGLRMDNGPAGVPAPVALVHGSWQHPSGTPRINHAWVVLSDGRIWEPITGLICDPILLMAYGQCWISRSYHEVAARTMRLRHQHYGPWQ